MYTELAEIPVPSSAQFIAPNVIEVSYTVRDHVRNTKKTMSKTIVLADNGCSSSLLQDISDIIASAISPSGKIRAVLREVKGDSQIKRYVELWFGSRLETSMDVTDAHGVFYADEFFGGISFSPSESAIIYTAEGKLPESEDPYARFRYVQSFGEGYTNKKRPTLFVFKWNSLDSEIENILISVDTKSLPAKVHFGQATFSPKTDKIIYATGYEEASDGRLLGIKGCYNRPVGIWQLRFSSSLPNSMDEGKKAKSIICSGKKLTPPHLSCRSPRVYSSNGNMTLFWYSCTSGGAHVSGSSLHYLDISQEEELNLPDDIADTILVPTVETPNLGDFPGLYPSYNLPLLPVLGTYNNSGAQIVLHSIWGSRTTIVTFPALKPGAVTQVTPDEDGKLYSWSILASDGNANVICQRSSTAVPYEILLGTISSEDKLSWRVIDKPDLSRNVENALGRLTTNIISIPERYPAETIVIAPKQYGSKRVLPCITFPHGGPHGTATTAFTPSTTALALEGYVMSLPNYTGSPGFGEKAIKMLMGKCGSLDVEDCIASVKHLVKLGIAKEGHGKLFITGGSHGGFLTAHLIGQYPDTFSGAILRNPVISCGEISTSDIPDWYFSEFGLDYDVSSSAEPPYTSKSMKGRIASPLMSPEAFAKLQAESPIMHIEKIKVPVLLLIGEADARVAPTQGKGFYHALKGLRAEGKGDAKVEMLIFEGEGHPLDGVEAAKVGFEVGRDWFAAIKK